MAKAKKRAKRKVAPKAKKKGKAARAAKPKRKPAAKRKKVAAKPKRAAKVKRKVAGATKRPKQVAAPGTGKLTEELRRWQQLHSQLQEQIKAKDSTIGMQMQEIMELKKILEELSSPSQ
ncbi:MAG: hypothetical protein ACE5IQ_05570 [Candidatus Methylomirabilales bacterium]